MTVVLVVIVTVVSVLKVTVVIVTVVRVTVVIIIEVTVVIVTLVVVTVVIVTYYSKNNLTPRKPMRFLRAAFCNLAMFKLEPPSKSQVFLIPKKTLFFFRAGKKQSPQSPQKNLVFFPLEPPLKITISLLLLPTQLQRCYHLPLQCGAW